MKFKFNSNMDNETIKNSLARCLERTKLIDEFCKENKIEELEYQDNHIEYTYKKTIRKEANKNE